MIFVSGASISENNTIDGEKGDQTKKEVKTDILKDFGQDTTIRFTNPNRARLFSTFCRIFADTDFVGYSQKDRYSLYNELGKRHFNIQTVMNDMANKKFPKCNADCSSFVSAMISLSYEQSMGVYTTDSLWDNLVTKYPKSFKKLKYNKSTLKLGDMLLKEKHHIVVVSEVLI